MKAVCISNFNYYQLRLTYVRDFYMANGYEWHYITGDYDTMNRQAYQLDIANVQQYSIRQYKKNISFERIYSHWDFAKYVYQQLNSLQPDVIYAMVPPNFVAHVVAKYKRQNPHVKVIYDVFDMWPETFPTTSLKRLILKVPFFFWRLLRDKAFLQADLVLSECQLFADALRGYASQLPVQTLYPCRPAIDTAVQYQSADTLSVCYLGSINNIIDIEQIERTLAAIQQYKNVTLHIIGKGEKQAEFITRMQKACHQVVYHGSIYDEQAKQAIFNQCAFGINILKTNVFIGLTLKSIDYFNGGLPVLNTVAGDTQHFVEQLHVGYMVYANQEDDLAQHISQLSTQDILSMKQHAKKLFQQHFCQTDYAQRLATLLEGVTK